MLSSQDARGPGVESEMRGGSDVAVANAEARYHRDRLALYRARVHGGKPSSLARLRELERAATRAEDWARRVRGR
jgi:hypothetical protein